MSETRDPGAVDAGTLDAIREAHAPQAYEFETTQTYCPSSDVPSDACHTCITLAVLDARAASAPADGLAAAVEALTEPASEDEGLRDHAYYFGFTQTGIGIIDRILSEVCRAGKGYHSTEYWQDTDPRVNGGKSYENTIQEAADAAATAIRAALTACAGDGAES